MPPFLCIGHRGAAGHEPENTLRSIRRALELGANGIEIDLRLSCDGELVVFHDPKLGRTTGAAGAVVQKTFAQLRELDAGAGEQIPTLREVLDLIGGRAWLNVELKAPGTALPAVREIVRAVERGDGWSYDGIVISSFDRRELARVGDPRVPVGVLVARRPVNIPKLVARFRASSLHLPARLATPKMIGRAHAAGVRVLVFTVNGREEIIRLRNLGVDGVFTDFPERAVAKPA
jgi:glycerophosphoryl diester phosphodiesterase